MVQPEQKKQKKPPTAADIRRIVEQAVKKIVCAEIVPLKKNMDYLMQKDNDEQVVADYLKKHPRRKTEESNQQWLNRELLKALIYALAIIAALVGAKLWQ